MGVFFAKSKGKSAVALLLLVCRGLRVCILGGVFLIEPGLWSLRWIL